MVFRPVWASALVCLVSVAAWASTAVGHPVPTGFAAGDDLVFTWGAVPVSTVVFDRCGGGYETFDVYDTLDPVDGDKLVLDTGWICGIRLNLSDRVELTGTGPSGSSFALSLGVTQIDIVVPTPFYVPNTTSGGTFIELATEDWITADLLDLDDDSDHAVVGANHALHDQLRDAIRYDSTAW